MSVCINKRDQYRHDTTRDIFVQYYRVIEKNKEKVYQLGRNTKPCSEMKIS